MQMVESQRKKSERYGHIKLHLIITIIIILVRFLKWVNTKVDLYIYIHVINNLLKLIMRTIYYFANESMISLCRLLA